MNPIFVVGSGRSGTSVITGALTKGAGIAGFAEGHLLPLAGILANDIDRYYGWKQRLLQNRQMMIAHVPQADLRRDVLEIFKRHAESFAAGERWVDKSPDVRMIRAIPVLLEMWPGAKFLFAKRRGIENVASRLRKFPHVDFDTHCRLWADCMMAWLDVRDVVGDAGIEIEQRDIALEPDAVAECIGGFLGLGEERTAGIRRVFATRRPECTGGTERDSAIALEDTGWDECRIQSFRTHCDAAFSAFGYSYGRDYSCTACSTA